MKAINKRATVVMDKLTEGLSTQCEHKVIDNADGNFMAVHVERLAQKNLGLLISVAHYYKQNGDMLRDPDMEFIVGDDGKYYPVYFRQDGGCGFEQEAVTYDSAGEIAGYRIPIQNELVDFANTWMKNIKEQQNL